MAHSSLPVEVWLEITKHLDVTELKTFRQVDKVCLATASKRLFQTVDLWPLIWSWRRLEHMSTSPHVRDYVETLCFHTNVLYEKYVEPHMEQRFRKAMLRRSQSKTDGAGATTASEQDIDALYAKYKLYVQAETEFRQVGPIAIRRAMCEFPNLRAVVCEKATVNLLDRGLDFLPGPSMIGMKLESNRTFEAGAIFARLDRPCMTSRLEFLTLSPMRWVDLPRADDLDSKAPPQTYVDETLRTLKLSLDYEEFVISSSMQDTYLTRLKDYISHYTNLETLTLSFESSNFQSNYAGILTKVSVMLTRLHIPRLRHLSLSNLLIDEGSMIKLLHNHSSTLNVLQLGQLGVGSPGSASDRESVMSLFWKTRDVTNLRKVTLKGLFTNFVDEAWGAVEEKKTSDCLCIRLEEFMCHKGVWPIGEDLQEFLVMRDARSNPLKDKINPLWEDASWKWSGYFLGDGLQNHVAQLVSR